MQHWTGISRSLAFIVIASVLIVGASAVGDYDTHRAVAGYDWTFADYGWDRARVDFTWGRADFGWGLVDFEWGRALITWSI
jgi:hypothetical protein